MKKNSEPSSFLDEQGEQAQAKIQKQQNQFKALFLKNARLQSKQKGTNVCQVLTPIICLIFTYLIKTVASDGLKVNIEFEDNNYPYKFNDFTAYDQLNNYTIKNTSGIFHFNNTRTYPLQYYFVECSEEACDKSFLGHNDGKKLENSTSGMLGNVPISYPNVSTFYLDPYEKEEQKRVSDQRYSPFFIQAEINKEIYKRLEVMGDNSITYIKNFTKHGLDYIPDGAIRFTSLNNNSFNAELKVGDCRDLDLHKINGISKNRQVKYYKETREKYNVEQQFTQAYGMLHIIHITTSSFIKTVYDKVVEGGFLLMPPNENTFVDTIINSIGALIYPLGLSLLFPVFLYSIVLQKEERLVQMMKMNGLKITNYWLTFFVFNLMLCVITNILFYLLGVLVVDSAFFTKTSPALLFIISLGWSLAQIGMAAFFQTFLSKSRSANIIGYLFSIWTTMIGATLNLGSYQYPSELPTGLQIIPPFAFVRTYYLMMMECSRGDCFYDMGVLSSEIKQCIVFLYIGFVVFFLLGIYLFEIVPQEFGVRRSPLFPIYALINLFKRKNEIQINSSEDPQLRDYISDHEEDDFSKKQRQKVINFSNQQNPEAIKNQYPLIINNMRKLYKKQGIEGFYPAVRSLNLAIGRRQTFGLLGPNGAGKTTLISMITGMYEPNFGNAWIGGYDIQTNIQKAQLQMGVCPQFDLVWPQLSVEEHLYFYARLKGIPEKRIKEQVQDSMKEVKLQKFAKFAASELSGGMRRRLSVAISLVGDPKIVFLDEPSTGLDPQNRRQLWAVLAQCQTKRALFITTHMMQQADTLCNRIGILTSGVLRTVETSIKLKKTYGEGYNVVINTLKEERQLISQESLHLGIEEERWFNEEQKVRESIGSFIEQENSKHYKLNQISRKIVEFMKKQFPGTYLFKHFRGYLILKVPSTFKISTLFETMNRVEKELGFSDLAITNSSLEDVFMNVVQKFDSKQKKDYPYNSDEIEGNDGVEIENYQENFNGVKPDPNQAINNSQSKYFDARAESVAKKEEDEHFDSVLSKKRQSVMSEHDGAGGNRGSGKAPSSDEQGEGQNTNNQAQRESKDSSSDYF